MNPKISIIVPAYNEEKNIIRCMESILNQTFADFEIIFIDDGSTDSTYDIVQEFSKKDSRIKAYKNKGKGVSAARNFGIEKASGDFIAFVDSDDYIQPQMYEFLYKAVSENNGDMSICDCIITGKTDVKSAFDYTVKECTCDYLIGNDKLTPLISVWSKLIKRDLLADDVLFPDLKIGEDLVFSSELWIRAEKVLFCEVPLYNYYVNSDSATHTDYGEIKWLDRPKAHLIAYENFLQYKEKNVSTWFLETGMKHLLTFLFYSGKKNKDETNDLYKKISSVFYRNRDITLANKIYVFISFHFPKIYSLRRKLLDKTLR